MHGCGGIVWMDEERTVVQKLNTKRKRLQFLHCLLDCMTMSTMSKQSQQQQRQQQQYSTTAVVVGSVDYDYLNSHLIPQVLEL